MRYLVLLVLLFSPNPALLASDVHSHGKGSKVRCPACNYVCEFSVQKVKEKKQCYEVECKPICIPPVTFPWTKDHGKGKDAEKSPPPPCGKVKIVRVLVKREYECSRCKFTWKAVPIKGGKKGIYENSGSSDGSDLEVPLPPPLDARFQPPVTLSARRR